MQVWLYARDVMILGGHQLLEEKFAGKWESQFGRSEKEDTSLIVQVTNGF